MLRGPAVLGNITAQRSLQRLHTPQEDSHCSKQKEGRDGRAADAFIARPLNNLSIAQSMSKHASH